MRAQDLNLVLKSFYELYGTDLEYMVLDEIHNVNGWELFVNRLRRVRRVVITGSNSGLLSGELATHLTGRHIDFTLLPFSFREFLTYKDTSFKELIAREYSTDTSVIAERALREYMINGGLPEAYKFGKDIVKSIFRDIVTKDVIRRHSIKNIGIIETLAKYLISNFSNEMTYNKLKNVFEVKITTIRNYINYFQEAYLIHVLERFSPKLKQQLIAPKKIYCIDTGIINAISFRAEENFGKIMENLVLIELLRRKSYWQNELQIYYWKDHLQHEVDFVVKDDFRVRQLIQVCYNVEDLNTREREIKALLKASNELRCKDLTIITWDREEEFKVDNSRIEFIPLWKWLLKLRV